MEITKHTHAANRSYEDFDPLFVWRKEESRDTLELHLAGFRRDQIRIQINHVGFLVISGERPIDGNKWKRFKKEFEIPSYCNEDTIHGNMLQSILSVVMPKKSPLIHQEEQEHKKERKENKKEETESLTKKTIAKDITHVAENQFEENDVRLPQETTREVALKFMLVMVLILVIASYLADVSKSLMAQGASYFHN
ncbi:Inactive protein RESTRICTED TEV MOVEMENT 2 [Spatholobus suberectus]|nr:Inactive protein RESTRICTED TEV MOVEMENT 2 [Spatholobus suberectus]